MQTCYGVALKVTELFVTELPPDCARPGPTLKEKPDPGRAAQLWLVFHLSPKLQDLAEMVASSSWTLEMFTRNSMANETGQAVWKRSPLANNSERRFLKKIEFKFWDAKRVPACLLATVQRAAIIRCWKCMHPGDFPLPSYRRFQFLAHNSQNPWNFLRDKNNA